MDHKLGGPTSPYSRGMGAKYAPPAAHHYHHPSQSDMTGATLSAQDTDQV